jgi:hypothetical protein
MGIKNIYYYIMFEYHVERINPFTEGTYGLKLLPYGGYDLPLDFGSFMSNLPPIGNKVGGASFGKGEVMSLMYDDKPRMMDRMHRVEEQKERPVPTLLPWSPHMENKTGGAEENYEDLKDGVLTYHDGLHKGMGLILSNADLHKKYSPQVKELLESLNTGLHKGMTHKIQKMANMKGNGISGGAAIDPVTAIANAAEAGANLMGGMWGPINMAVKSKSDWDYRGRELSDSRKDKDNMIRLMTQESDPDRRLEYAKMIYSIS